ncbi:MAG: hypothetical protein EOM24_37680 [Chloroflexia bacterium]|nr:hypothetical protein [Chloroflexia bacterium]
MIGWQEDKRWSDRFLHEIKGHIGQALISEPPVEEDRDRNTDLVVLRLDAIRIGCRVRKHDQIRYRDEFTIRSGRPSGAKTELTKIIEGWGDYFFYGFADENESRLALWLIGDLKAFRIWHSRQLAIRKGASPGFRKNNLDNSSSFHAFRWAEIPGFVVAGNHQSISAAA